MGVSHLARRESIDRIVPLDDFDLEKASALREHLRVPGMGETTTRYFRDKLAMRVKAASDGLPVPGFVHTLNEARIRDFCAQVAPPWFLKPRQQAGAIGIRKIENEEALWAAMAELGDASAHFLLESFVPGDVYHVDSIVYEREVRMAVASQYGTPPFDVSHGGGVFTTSLIERGTALERDLLELNRRLLTSLGLVRGVSHSEYILGRDGQFVFLETSARVGGAHIAELVEAATGLNLWAEWAKIEVAGGESAYEARPSRTDYAGLIVSLARQEQSVHRRVYRPGSGVAAEQAPSRRTDRALAVVRTGGAAGRVLSDALCRRFRGHAAAEDLGGGLMPKTRRPRPWPRRPKTARLKTIPAGRGGTKRWPMATRVWLTMLGAMLAAALGTAQTPPAAEWSQWRGANRDGISAETGLLKDWPAGGPPLAWQTHRRRHRLLVVLHLRGTPLHHRRARRRGVRDGVRSRQRQEAVGDAERPPLPQRAGRRPAQHADHRRRRHLRLRRQRRAVVARRRDRPEDLVGERRPAVRRRDAVLGLQRIAAHRRRPHRPGRRRPAGVDRRGEQGGRQGPVAAAGRRGRLLLTGAAAHGQPAAGGLLHGRARAGGGSAGWPPAVVARPRGEQHRQRRHARS